MQEFVKSFIELFLKYLIQHCLILRSSDSIVSEEAKIEPMAFTMFKLTIRLSNHSARSYPQVVKFVKLPR